MVLAAQVFPLEWGHDSSQASVSQCNLQPQVTLTGVVQVIAGLRFSIHNGHYYSCPRTPGPRAFPTTGCSRVRGVRHLDKVGGEFAGGVSV